MLSKKEMRFKIKQLNKENENRDFKKEDSIILERIKKNPSFKKASTVLLFYPFKEEVNILPLFDYCLEQNKKVALPKTYKEYIEFYLIDENWRNNLKKGIFNTIEPIDGPVINSFEPLTLAIIPSMALSKDKSRLGHGKGYYDKFLSKHKNLIKIGVCRNYLLFNSLPTDSFDIKVDEIISSN